MTLDCNLAKALWQTFCVLMMLKGLLSTVKEILHSSKDSPK